MTMERTTSFDGTEIAFVATGPAPTGRRRPVLLLHGFASDHRDDWVRPGVVDAVVASGRRVVATDARGHGESDTPHDPQAYADDTMVRDAQVVLDHLHVEAVDVAGYSMGALVAARLAAVDPRVRSVILAGAGGNLRRDSTDSGDGGLAAALLVDDPDRITHPVGRAFRAFADRSGADRHALAAIERSTSLAFDVDFAAITVPTLVLIGEADRRVGSPEELAGRITGAQLQVVAGDHLSAVRDPGFARALVEFLERSDGVREPEPRLRRSPDHDR
jgi:pimeloyl-ACP methyl ester carboxylesterase